MKGHEDGGICSLEWRKQFRSAVPKYGAPTLSAEILRKEVIQPQVPLRSAHLSPQLIAACHVLHRLCMPRHPPIALTSRLRIHTTNDKFGTRSRWLCRARLPRPCLPWVSTRRSSPRGTTSTQLDINVVNRHAILPPAGCPIVSRNTCRSRHRFLEPIHNVKEGRERPNIRGRSREILVFIPGKFGERVCAVSRSKAAPYGALRSAGRSCTRSK